MATPATALFSISRKYTLAAKVIAILIALLGIVLVLWLKPKPLNFWEFTKDDIVRLFTELTLIALVIERGVEIFITPWREGDRKQIENNIKAARKMENVPQATALEGQVIQYRQETRQITFVVGLAIGVIVSAVGIRILQFLVQPQTLDNIAGTRQATVFTGLDVLLTGALLAGGADQMHKIISVFANFMDSSAAKAKGDGGAA